MNIKHHVGKFKEWFEQRNLREKLLTCGLSWAFIYAVFAVLLFNHIDASNDEMAVNLKKTQDQITSWKTQLKYLKDIPNTALYKEWLKEHQYYITLKNQYKNLIGKNGTGKWDDIIKAILSNYPNITVDKIENSPESAYQASKIQSEPEMLYQQRMKLTVIGNFQDIVGYLTSLEKALPNIHWDTLDYDVTEYPLARVAMGFSILYEKPKS